MSSPELPHDPTDTLFDLARTLERLHAFHPQNIINTLHGALQEAYYDRELDIMADLYGDQLQGFRDGPRPETQPITPDSWDELIDPGQPTIGLHPWSVADGPLLAMASQRMRARGEPGCNFVLLPPELVAREFTTHRGKYRFAQRGILVDQHGVMHKGDFPEPIRLDAINSEDLTSHTDRQQIKLINTPEQQKFLKDKLAVMQTLDQAGIRHPRLYGVHEPHQQASAEIILELLNTHDELVVKPSSAALGQGVLLLDKKSVDPDELTHQLAACHATHQKIMAEERIHSLPLSHPNSGVPLDWNMRMLIVGGRLIGTYVRQGRYGGPVNISQGARPKNLQKTLTSCGLDIDDQMLVMGRLGQLARKIHETIDANFMGVDICLPADLEPTVIEINDERSGGLRNVAICGSRERFAAPEAAVRALRNGLFPRYKPRQAPKIRRPVPVSVTDRQFFRSLAFLAAEGPEEKAFVQSHVNRLAISPGVPDEIRFLARELHTSINARDTQELSVDPRIDSSRAIAIGEVALGSGLVEVAHNSLAIAANADPTNTKTRSTIAEILIENDEAAIELFARHTRSTESTQAQAIALVWHTIDQTIEHDELSIRTSKQLEHIVASYLSTPLHKRTNIAEPLNLLFTELSASEQNAVLPVLDTLVTLDALARQDYATAGDKLAAAPHPLAEGAESYAPISGLVMSHLEHTTDPLARYAYSIASLRVGDLPSAIQSAGHLPPELLVTVQPHIAAAFVDNLAELGLVMESDRLRQITTSQTLDQAFPEGQPADIVGQLIYHLYGIADALHTGNADNGWAHLRDFDQICSTRNGLGFDGVIDFATGALGALEVTDTES